ncbi:MAG: methylenetetrahydrofolate reductase [Nitrososphaerota archaeon]
MNILLQDVASKKKHPIIAELPGSGSVEAQNEVNFAKEGENVYDAVLATDIPTGRIRVDSLIVCQHIIQQTSLDVVAAISTRHRSMEASIAKLLGLWSIGVRSVYAVMGDSTPSSSPSNAKYQITGATSLLEAIASLRRGFLRINGRLYRFAQPFNFFAGGALVPSRQGEVELTRQKLALGASFFITQALFEAESLFSFIDRLRSEGVKMEKPIFVTLPIVHKLSSLERMAKMPGVYMPDGIVNSFKSAQDLESFSVKRNVELFREVSESLKNIRIGAYILPLPGSNSSVEMAKSILHI